MVGQLICLLAMTERNNERNIQNKLNLKTDVVFTQLSASYSILNTEKVNQKETKVTLPTRQINLESDQAFSKFSFVANFNNEQESRMFQFLN